MEDGNTTNNTKYSLEEIAHSKDWRLEFLRDHLITYIHYADYGGHPYSSSAADCEVSEDDYADNQLSNIVEALLPVTKFDAKLWEETGRTAIRFGRKLWEHQEAVKQIARAKKGAARKNGGKKAVRALDYALWRYEQDLIPLPSV